jgi:hypothetical protein
LYYACTTLYGLQGEEGGAGLGKGISGETLQGEGMEGVAFAGDERSFDT